MLTPRILIVDDERQIHASLRLRLARDYELSFAFSGSEALRMLSEDRFDLCLADINMPGIDGLTFIRKAGELDQDMGFVVLSAFDTDENLRRAIPLHVYDFIGKPLPEKDGFELLIPDWVARTRRKRKERGLSDKASTIARDLDSAKLEREVELVASESARDCLLQTAGLLTTINAHLANAAGYMASRHRTDPTAAHLWRGMEEARKTAEAAATVVEAFFDSGYGNRDNSPALVATGVRHAVSIAGRLANPPELNKSIDLCGLDDRVPLRDLSGIDFLLALVPAIEVALVTSPANSTIRITSEPLARLDAVVEGPRGKHCLWVNRRKGAMSQPGIAITIASGAPALARSRAEAWLFGEDMPLAGITARGLIRGIKKCKGTFAVSVLPHGDLFRVILVFPT